MDNYIHLRGVRENNLKNINLDIPRDKLVVLTGLSGCGKSSLAFDTIFAEGQRRAQAEEGPGHRGDHLPVPACGPDSSGLVSYCLGG